MKSIWRVGKSGLLGNILRTIVFLVGACALVILYSPVIEPSFSMYSRSVGEIDNMYEQPQESVQVIAVGASAMRRGVSPVALYEDYGITALNCSTEAQPAMLSSYVLSEALQKQARSAKVAVVDVDCFIRAKDDYARMAGAFEALRPSFQKLVLLKEMLDYFEEVDPIEQLIPTIHYHNRWSELKWFDFCDAPTSSSETFICGQGLSCLSNAMLGKAGRYTEELNKRITDEIEASSEDIERHLSDDSVRHLEELVMSCRSKGVEVLLFKPPESVWDDDDHDCANYLAKKVQVPFLDMSSPQILDECGISYDYDYEDGAHANTLGSLKITDYLGKYLVSHYDFDDGPHCATGNVTEDDRSRFHEAIEDAQVCNCDTLGDYLEVLSRERYSVCIAVHGEASDGLNSSVRAKLKSLGLKKLSYLSENESYVGILNGGDVLVEECDKDGGEVSVVVSSFAGRFNNKPRNMQNGAVLDSPITLVSIGADEKPAATIQWGAVRGDGRIETMDWASDTPGINFVVRNNETNALVDKCSFDTHKAKLERMTVTEEGVLR